MDIGDKGLVSLAALFAVTVVVLALVGVFRTSTAECAEAFLPLTRFSSAQHCGAKQHVEVVADGIICRCPAAKEAP